METKPDNGVEAGQDRATDDQLESIFKLVTENTKQHDFQLILNKEELKDTIFEKDQFDAVSIDYKDEKTINIGGNLRKLPVLSINTDKYTCEIECENSINEVSKITRKRIIIIDNHNKKDSERRFYIVVKDFIYEYDIPDFAEAIDNEYQLSPDHANQILEILKANKPTK
jgi:hypothetical protein